MSPGRGSHRRALLRAALGALPVLAGRAQAQAAETALPTPASLRLAAQEATARGEPLVLLVSLPGCPFCEHVRRHYLAPMRAEGLAAFQIHNTDRHTPLRNFADQPSTGAEIAQAYRARFAPTVLFLNPRGEEIAERIRGIGVADFYGGYLEERLATARRVLRK